MPNTGKSHAVSVTVPLRRIPKYESMLPQIVEMAEAGSGIDLISRALGVCAEVVRDALHLHRTGERPPGRIDGRRGRKRKPGPPPAPKYQQIAAEVDRRRKAGEGFDRLAREMKVGPGTIRRAYDFANREEAIAAAKEGRKPKRPSGSRAPVEEASNWVECTRIMDRACTPAECRSHAVTKPLPTFLLAEVS
jgi:hypothetical protein